ncbi:MAG: glycosyltransferase family 4 protein [Spirochaetota bacterium]
MLISGLPLHVKSSFSRQLKLLGSHLEDLGIGIRFNGPSTSLSELESTDACILLGYPDQFLFLEECKKVRKTPLFLWAQFSRPPEPETLDGLFLVPLTPKTSDFLCIAGLKKVHQPIPHGVDTGVFHPVSVHEKREVREELGIKNGFLVGTVGANSLRKRFDRIIEAFALFNKWYGDAFLIIKTNRVISYDGIDIAKLAHKAGILDRCIVIERELSQEELCRIYGAMDIYINLSEWEGFCIPVIEAMACGVPVVSLPIQGPGEIIPYDDLIVRKYSRYDEEGATLLLADPEEAAMVIFKVAENLKLRSLLSLKGLREVEDRYDIRLIARAWEGLIRSIKV